MSLVTFSWSRDASKQYLSPSWSRLDLECYYLGLSLESHCVGHCLGVAITVLVLSIEIETVQVTCYLIKCISGDHRQLY